MILYAYRNGYSRSRIFQSEAHLKLKEILKNIIIESCFFFLFFAQSFSFAVFFYLLVKSRIGNLKIRKKGDICEKAYVQTRSKHYLFRFRLHGELDTDVKEKALIECAEIC